MLGNPTLTEVGPDHQPGTARALGRFARHRDAGHGADAFATTFWWVLGATVLTALPAPALARFPAPAPAAAEPVPA